MKRITICALCLVPGALAQDDAAKSGAKIRRSLTLLARSEVEFELELPPHKDGSLRRVAFDARGKRVLVATSKRVLFRDLDAKRSWEPKAPRYGFADASFANDGSVVLASSSAATRWRYGAPEELETIAGVGDLHRVVYARCDVPRRLAIVVTTANMVPGNAQIELSALQHGSQRAGAASPETGERDDVQARVIPIRDRWGARAAELSPSGAWLAVLSGGGATLLVRTKDGKVREKLRYYYDEADEKGTRGGWSPTDYAFSCDERVLFIADTRGFVRAWDIERRRQLGRWRASRKGAVQSIAIGPSDDVLFSFHADGSRAAWLVRRPSHVHELATPELPPGRLVFGPRRRRFATVTKDKVRVWKLRRR